MAKKTLLEVFDDNFLKEMKNARTNTEAYDRAMQRFEQEHGFSAFDSYDSFRMQKQRARKKKA